MGGVYIHKPDRPGSDGDSGDALVLYLENGASNVGLCIHESDRPGEGGNSVDGLGAVT